MAADLQQLIDGLSAKTRVLAERYAIVVSQRDRVIAANKELRHALRQSQSEVGRLRQRLELLSVSANLTPDSTDIAATRTMLSGLLREIDKCITELTD